MNPNDSNAGLARAGDASIAVVNGDADPMFAGVTVPVGTPWRDVVTAVPQEQIVDVIHADEGSGSPDSLRVVDLTDDSRQVVPGGVFACVRGANFDGHRFAQSAVAAGAVAFVVDHPLQVGVDIDRPVDQLIVQDVRRAVGWAAAAVHGFPARELTMIGVTGTNGKTTTTQMIATILNEAGLEAATIGTLSGARTTPEAADLQRRLRQLRTDGVAAVVMEVSSHALAMHRVAGIQFDVATFTNLGQDHLDLHGSVEDYFRAKAQLFTPELCRRGVVNADDPRGLLLIDTAPVDLVAYSGNDLSGVEVSADRIRFNRDDTDFDVPIGGQFNLANLNAAIVTVEQIGVSPDVAARGLAHLDQIPGRFEVVSSQSDDIVAIVDYAHTPDGLTELLRAVRDVATGRVIAVFGCGGDRDQTKRPLMGRAAAEGADVVVVTSDNPRHENPQDIIDAIVGGIPSGYREDFTTQPNRFLAIEQAVSLAHPADVVVVAGKGHETTQTTDATTVHFDDREVTRTALAHRREQRAAAGLAMRDTPQNQTKENP